jgi:hypothetical protein
MYEGGCTNVCIQRGETKRTIMGRSAIAGWGLFAGEKVKAGAFLGVISLVLLSDCRNTRVKSSAMKKAKDEDCCTTRKGCHSCLLLIKVIFSLMV